MTEIVTTFLFPPIPMRSFDWLVWLLRREQPKNRRYTKQNRDLQG